MKRIMVLFFIFTILFAIPCDLTAKSTNPIFSDVDKDHYGWAQESIEFLARKDIINGTGNKIFSPNDLITRAQECALLVKAFNLKPSGEDIIFVDVKNHWAKNYITTAVSLGIIGSYKNNEFKPNQVITRQEFCVTISKTLKSIGITENLNENDIEDQLSFFADNKKINPSVGRFIAQVVKNGIITGYSKDGKYFFGPENTCTRAEFAVVLKRTYDLVKSTPTIIYDTSLPDISLSDIAEGNPGVGPFKITLINEGWQSYYWNLDFQNRPNIFKYDGFNITNFAYRYAIFDVKGAKGGEQFRFGLAIGPTDYLGPDLTTQWQTMVIDLSNRNPEYIYQIGFEIGSDWTENKIGTEISVNNIKFSNILPSSSYLLIDNHLPPYLEKIQIPIMSSSSNPIPTPALTDQLIGGPGTPEIDFIRVPKYGTYDDLVGKVLHIKNSDYKVAIYIKIDNNWYFKPTTTINSDGIWICDITTNENDQNTTQIEVYLIPSDYSPDSFSNISETRLHAVAAAGITRPKDLY